MQTIKRPQGVCCYPAAAAFIIAFVIASCYSPLFHPLVETLILQLQRAASHVRSAQRIANKSQSTPSMP